MKTLFRNKAFYTMLILGLLFITACQATPTLQPTHTSEPLPATVTPEPTAATVPQELTIGLGRNLYYGANEWYILHGSLGVWEPLVILDNDMIAQPVLATSWDMS